MLSLHFPSTIPVLFSFVIQHSGDKALTSGREAPGSSFLKALQQLGHSCGQSVMAADLAAFVTHKQLLGGVVAVEAALQHSRPAGSSLQAGKYCALSLWQADNCNFQSRCNSCQGHCAHSFLI
jgi:hypothetical protein